MADIEKIVDNLNIPKQIIDKSEQLLKTLFGPSMDEFAGMIADNVRLRRFKNQIKIFGKAQDIMKEKKIDPKRVSLKVLAPLLEYSSYEEEEKLQDMWSNLTANALTITNDDLFQQNSIAILNKLSSLDALLLADLYNRLQIKRKERHENRNYATHLSSAKDYLVTNFSFSLFEIANEKKLTKNDFHFRISNLIGLGLLRWDTDVQVEATKRYEDPNDTDIDVSVYVYNDDDFTFTAIGEKFVEVVQG